MRLPLAFAALAMMAPLHADDTLAQRADQSFHDQQFDQAIELYTQLIEEVPDPQKGEVLVKLALAHYRDQNDIAAFATYIQALDCTPEETAADIDAEEQGLCVEALEVYLDPHQRNPRTAAIALRQRFAPIVDIHPEFQYLNFFVTAAYANLGMFDSFFEKFYPSYQAHSGSYMAQKSRGLLHMKLFERLADAKAREHQRQQAIACFQKALEKNIRDVGLMKMLIATTEGEQHEMIVRNALQTILTENIVVPRLDVLFFVRAAADVGDISRAQQFVERAKEWYNYSRAITTAERLIEQQKDSTGRG